MSWDLKLALNISHYAICLVLKKEIKKNLEMNQQRFSFKKKKKKRYFNLQEKAIIQFMVLEEKKK